MSSCQRLRCHRIRPLPPRPHSQLHYQVREPAMRMSRLAALAARCAPTPGCADRIIDAPPQLAQAPTCPAYATPTIRYATSEAAALAELTYLAVDKITFCSQDIVSGRVPIAVSSITNAQHLDRSSTFGNMVADFARAPAGLISMDVSEPRLRHDLLMRADEGEMFLSRDPSKLTVPHRLYAAVTDGDIRSRRGSCVCQVASSSGRTMPQRSQRR